MEFIYAAFHRMEIKLKIIDFSKAKQSGSLRKRSKRNVNRTATQLIRSHMCKCEFRLILIHTYTYIYVYIYAFLSLARVALNLFICFRSFLIRSDRFHRISGFRSIAQLIIPTTKAMATTIMPLLVQLQFYQYK